MSKRPLPEINAGSMADIAFLLLIFFLVTTTMDVDSGIIRKIPEKQQVPPIEIHERNILEVNINKNNEIYVNNAIVEISNLKEMALNFIDNGGGVDIDNKPCTWCKGEKNPKSSDHPKKAVVSISSDRDATYETYVSVLDNLNGAYVILRNRLAKEMYSVSYTELLGQLKNETKNKEPLVEKVMFIRGKYPLLISDAEIQN